jgi:hypothetical protein
MGKVYRKELECMRDQGYEAKWYWDPEYGFILEVKTPVKNIVGEELTRQWTHKFEENSEPRYLSQLFGNLPWSEQRLIRKLVRFVTEEVLHSWEYPSEYKKELRQYFRKISWGELDMEPTP